MALKPRDICEFSPSKVSRYTVAHVIEELEECDPMALAK